MLTLLLILLQAPIFQATVKPEKVEAKPSERYLVVFTASWCGPCKQWKQSEKPKLSGVAITTVDVDAEPQWGVGTVPSFWICDRATRKPLKKFTGSTSAATLLKELESTSPASTPASSGGQIFGRTGTSHESRETLIKHLLSDGIHAGKHTAADLSAMTDVELDALHNRDHNENAGTPASTTWTIQPKRVQTVRRRRGLFFEW